MRNGKPTLAIVGYGRAGKDTAAEWFRDNTGLRFEGGCSWYARHYMAERLGVSPEEAFANRHRDRKLWFDYMNEFRAADATALVRLVLSGSDIVCGIRSAEELFESRRQGLIDLVIWIENPRHTEDITVTYCRSDADIVILNEADIATYHKRLKNLAIALQLI